MNKPSTTTYILWAIFISLLAVLLPHTAWAFRQFEPTISPPFLWGLFQNFTNADAISFTVAFAFEASIAVLTHKLAKRIEETPRRVNWWGKAQYRYLNGIAIGLLIATVVSGMANLAHAVEFGKSLAIFAQWGIPANVYSVAFGGILPLVSLTFANVLSNVVESEEAPNPELTQLNEQLKNLRSQLRESEQQRRAAEDKARVSEERFGAMGDLVKRLFGEDKRERILAIREWKPNLPGSVIATLADSSQAYVSEILSKN